MFILRPYQKEVKQQIFNAWSSMYLNVLLRMPTGSGKTVTFCSLVLDTLRNGLNTAIIVHRKELVQQICLTLAKEKIPHNIIAARKDIKGIIAAERRLFKQQFYDPTSKVTVISVDTIISRFEHYKEWGKTIHQWIVDEATHLLKENKWGRAVTIFPNARGLGVTATPERLDKKGLGRHADGVFDYMIEGPETKWLIDQGYLCDYKIALPHSDYEKFLKDTKGTSDYSRTTMAEASKQSAIVGDVVDSYLKHANGKQAILFATDVNTAKAMEKKFNDRGIPAKSLDAKTPDKQRLDTILDFQEKKIKVLINVDLFDEGLDVPGIECVIMARPTKSLSKYLQMVGRGLRVAPNKPYLILIDHVGNIMGRHGKTGHGLPDKVRHWTLDRIRKSKEKLNFLRICSNINCNAPYDRALTECPWCGTEAIKYSNSGESARVPPEFVDGDLFLIDPDTIRELEAMVELESPADIGKRVGSAVNAAAGMRAMKNQAERIRTQQVLAEAIALWAGKMKHYYHYTDRMIHKKFYLYHNQTITEALGQPKMDMENLINELNYGEY